MDNHFQACILGDRHPIFTGRLPNELLPSADDFHHLWLMHPTKYHAIKIHGRTLPTPRWGQAYNKAYCYSGSMNQALPVPDRLQPFWQWSKLTIDRRLNGILVNWYDGQLGHYIGKHRDSTKNMARGTPIVTISLGEQRLFRLRPWRGKGYQDILVDHGTAIVMPYETNLAWTHEVPASSKLKGKRISITLRAFQ